jgi:hypothetical protein
MKKIFFSIILLSIMFSCRGREPKNNDLIIISKESNRTLTGEIVVRGDPDLNMSRDIVILDSVLVLIDNYSADIFRCYDINSYEKKKFFGIIGEGPDDFNFPMLLTNRNQKSNTFSVFDVVTGKMSNIFTDGNVVKIDSKYIHEMNLCTNINQIDSVMYAGTPNYPETPQGTGIYFFFNTDSKKFRWVDYSTELDKIISKQDKRDIYYSTMCVNAQKNNTVVALLHFNRLLLFDMDGKLLKEIQIGETFITPKIDVNTKKFKNMIYHFVDLQITNNHIYALWTDSYEEKIMDMEVIKYGIAKVFVFDLEMNHVETLQLDQPIMEMDVAKDDTYILGTVEDGTGLTDVVKYKLN